MRAKRADFQGLNRQFKVIDRARRRGKVENRINMATDVNIVRHILMGQRKSAG